MLVSSAIYFLLTTIKFYTFFFFRHFKTQHHHIPTEDQQTFDTLCLADIKPKKTWLEVHEEFYREPPKNPGKILLLYSRDSKIFTDLQQAFRRSHLKTYFVFACLVLTFPKRSVRSYFQLFGAEFTRKLQSAGPI